MPNVKAKAVKRGTKKNPQAEWTIMAYLAGDNNLDGAGVTDLREMKKVGSSAAVNVIAQFDRAGSRGTTKRFYLRRGTDLAKDAIADLGETDTGDPRVLCDFFDWGVQHYPARRYMLVIWNHGAGWDDSNLYADHGDYFSGDPPPISRKGVVMNAAGSPARVQSPQGKRTARPVPMAQARSAVRHAHRALFASTVDTMVKSRAIAFDDQAKDFLDNMELKRALAAMKKTLGRPLDIIGFDACLMAMLEVDFQVMGGAAYTVGSEEEEPGNGWPYDRILKALAAKPGIEPAALARIVVTQYAASYGAGDGVTLAAAELDKSREVAAAVDELGRALRTIVDNASKATLLSAVRAKVQEYSAPYDDYVDLVDLCDGLQRLLGDAKVNACCAKVKEAVAKMVLQSAAKGSAVARSHGISIYFPKRKVCPLYARLDFAKGNAWAGFIAAYAAKVAKQGWG
ncbi:MAG TPA: clostripain-related cysteine peptidase [Casimicrobiaceae bacterium]|nr:clostripain-related cysteine peptidase [Casimicrobiaceae bacterium]